MKYLMILCICFLSACMTNGKNEKKENKSEIMDMVRTDRNFSDYSKKEGLKKAFIEYLDDEGVLLRPGYYPMVGVDAIRYLENQEDTSFTLTWEPMSGMMAKSNDLGFTFGVYSIHARDTSWQGTYVSIWKKKEDGSWKLLLDAGNPGVGEARPDLKFDFKQNGDDTD